MNEQAFKYFEALVNERFATVLKNQEKQDERIDSLEKELGDIKSKVITFSAIVSGVIAFGAWLIPIILDWMRHK